MVYHREMAYEWVVNRYTAHSTGIDYTDRRNGR